MIISPKILAPLTAIFLFCTTSLLYVNLGRDYVYEWDESIYAELGRELSANNFLTPTWNQELWLEKPPLIAYLTAVGQKIVDDPELGSRLYVPIATLITLASVYVIGHVIGGTVVGVVGVSMLSYFDLFISRSRSVNTDILLVAGITLSLALILKNAKPLLVALSLSLAIFAKGPAGLLAILIVIPALVHKPKKFLLYTAGYYLLFTIPWHLYQLVVNGSAFYSPYLLEQVLRRATVPIEFHLESRWFYFLHLYKDLGLGVILTALIGLAISLKQKTFLLAWWAVLPLALFTLAKTRLAWYILPIYPSIALSIGYLFGYLSKDYKKSQQGLIVILVIGMLAQSLYSLYHYVDPGRTTTTYPDHVLVAKDISSYPEGRVAFLVSASERTAEAILPKSQRLSSSFRYGGAPSVVFYTQKNTTYYYNYDHFVADLTQAKFEFAIVTTADSDKIPKGYSLISETDGYLGYQKVEPYAKR